MCVHGLETKVQQVLLKGLEDRHTQSKYGIKERAWKPLLSLPEGFPWDWDQQVLGQAHPLSLVTCLSGCPWHTHTTPSPEIEGGWVTTPLSSISCFQNLIFLNWQHSTLFFTFKVKQAKEIKLNCHNHWNQSVGCPGRPAEAAQLSMSHLGSSPSSCLFLHSSTCQGRKRPRAPFLTFFRVQFYLENRREVWLLTTLMSKTLRVEYLPLCSEEKKDPIISMWSFQTKAGVHIWWLKVSLGVQV